VAIQGFGNVGLGIAKFLENKGCTVVAITDFWGGIHNAKGINISQAEEYSYAQSESQSIKNFSGGSPLPRDGIFNVDCDVFIPCACGDVLTKQTIPNLKAKLVVEGANNATTPVAEHRLYKKGVIIIPDFLANAGGVIGSYAEYKNMTVEEAFSLIESKIKSNTITVVEGHRNSGCLPRLVAEGIAEKRILKAMDRKTGWAVSRQRL